MPDEGDRLAGVDHEREALEDLRKNNFPYPSFGRYDNLDVAARRVAKVHVAELDAARDRRRLLAERRVAVDGGDLERYNHCRLLTRWSADCRDPLLELHAIPNSLGLLLDVIEER